MKESDSGNVGKGNKTFNIRHRCFYFSKDVIHFVRENKVDGMCRSMFSQLIRSATSIGANVVEGKAGSTKKDWVNFYVIGLKSANETKYWLCLIRDTMSVNKRKVEELIKEADEISKIIASIIINAASK
jgi:four helix bundle protein